MSGWIKLHRKILDNPIVCKDSEHVAVWAYLLLNATHKSYHSVFAGKKIILQPGQLITGRKVISEKFKISESKVQRILKSFENEQQIEQQPGNKNRLITVLSWEDYQSNEQQDEQQLNNNRTTTEQQVNTNKNVKKEKKVKESKIAYSENVHLTETEYQRLVDEYGKELTDKSITYLSSYKVEKGYTTKSDNLTIRRWVLDATKKDEPKQKISGRTPIPLPLYIPTPSNEKEEDIYDRAFELQQRRNAEPYGRAVGDISSIPTNV